MLQMGTPGMSAAAAGHRRALLDVQGGAGPQLSSSGAVLPNPAAPVPPLTGYQAELAHVTNITQTAVAAVIPGLLPSQVVVTITGAPIQGRRSHGLASEMRLMVSREEVM